MKTDIMFLVPGYKDPLEMAGHWYQGILTTDHAASSHGLPVVVAQDGRALGPAEVESVYLSTYVETDDVAGRDIHREITDEDRELLDAARRAGYRLLRHWIS